MNLGTVPDSWKKSNTKLIPKSAKPTVDQLRPIALTDISYKILMGILKTKIENHLRRNNAINDMQTGGTAKRRVTENIFIFSYLIEKCVKEKKNLFVTSIDFKKAYDSIDRFKMIEIMQEFKINPKIINLIANIYHNDKTALFLNSEEITQVDITTGIRQGCNLSGLLFVLVTYKIIEELKAGHSGVRIGNINHTSLFYMDDALLFTKDEVKTHVIISRIESISAKYGLKLNKNKCHVLVYNNEKNELDSSIVSEGNGRKTINGIGITNTINCTLGCTLMTSSTALRPIRNISKQKQMHSAVNYSAC